MQRFFRLFLVGVILALLGGCGGGGNVPGFDVVFSVSREFGPNGGEMASRTYNIDVRVLPGALNGPSLVRMDVYRNQRPGVERNGFIVSRNRLSITVQANRLNPGGWIETEFPMQGIYDRLGTMMFVMHPNGLRVPLRVDVRGARMVGRIRAGELEAIGFNLNTNDLITFDVFTAEHALTKQLPPPLITSVMKYDLNSGTWVGLTGNDSMAGKRVGFMVHGVTADLSSMSYLANMLLTQTGGYYDEVWGFQYTSNAPLAEIGTAMADSVVGEFSQALGVDVFAHSMGNLVSRYAMETQSLGSRVGPFVQHFVGLGGPHEGVPFEVAQSILFEFDPDVKPCIVDLTTETIGGGQSDSDFLANLNGPTSPEVDTAKYYTVAATDYSAEAPPVGDIMNAAYYVANGFHSLPNDGLVAVYSADDTLNRVLASKSTFWSSKVWPTVDLSHSGLRGSAGGCSSSNPSSAMCVMQGILLPWINAWKNGN